MSEYTPGVTRVPTRATGVFKRGPDLIVFRVLRVTEQGREIEYEDCEISREMLVVLNEVMDAPA